MLTYRPLANDSYSCQLTTAVNARIYLGGPDVTAQEWDKLVDACGCKHGTPLSIELAYDVLGIVAINGPRTTRQGVFDWVCQNLPAEILYQDPKFGFHSALVADIWKHKLRMVWSSFSQEWVEFDQIVIPNWMWGNTHKNDKFPDWVKKLVVNNRICRTFNIKH